MPHWLKGYGRLICTMLVLALAVYIGTHYGPGKDWVEGREKHGDVTVAGPAPEGFNITKDATAKPSVYLFKQASDAYTLSGAKAPAGKLEFEVPLKAGITADPKKGVLALMGRAPNGKWKLQDVAVKPSADGKHAVFTLSAEKGLASGAITSGMQLVGYHTGLGWNGVKQFAVGWLPFDDFVKDFKATMNGILEGTPAEKAPALECYNEAEAKEGGYGITWQGKNAKLVNWCMGFNHGEGGKTRRYVEIANPSGYPLLLKFTKGMTAHKNTVWQLNAASAARIGTGSNSLVLYPKSKVEMNVGDLPGMKLKATVAHTEYDGLAQALHNVDVAAESLLMILAKWGKVPGAAKFIDDMLGDASCINAVMAADTGRVFRECFSEKLIRQVLTGAVAIIAIAVIQVGLFAGKIMEFVSGGTKGVVEQGFGRDRYWVRVEYKNVASCDWMTTDLKGRKGFLKVSKGNVGCQEAQTVINDYYEHLRSGNVEGSGGSANLGDWGCIGVNVYSTMVTNQKTECYTKSMSRGFIVYDSSGQIWKSKSVTLKIMGDTGSLSWHECADGSFDAGCSIAHKAEMSIEEMAATISSSTSGSGAFAVGNRFELKPTGDQLHLNSLDADGGIVLCRPAEWAEACSVT